MSTAGLELAKLIDPSLTWKTVCKGRNTSRRRPASKNLKMVQEQGKKSSKRVNGAPLSETEKSDETMNGRRFASNMEHIPIKKRRFLMRSPSPPPQSSNFPEAFEGLDSAQCASNQHTIVEETQVKGSDSSSEKSNKSISDGNVDENTVKSANGVHGSGEDFSGIAILAAAACGGGLDYSADIGGKSQMGDILKGEQSKSFASATSVLESITCSKSPDSLGKGTVCVKEEASLPDFPDSITVGSLKTNGDEICSSQNKSFACATSANKSITRFESPDSLGKGTVHVKEEGCLAVFPDGVTVDNLERKGDDVGTSQTRGILEGGLNESVGGQTMENCLASRDCRLHWDLNTVMDEWDHPLDDAIVDSSMHCVEATPKTSLVCENFQNGECLESLKRSETMESGVRIMAQPVVCSGAGSMALPDYAGFTSETPPINMTSRSLEVASGLLTGILKENGSPHNTNNHDLNHSLSLGLSTTTILVSVAPHITASGVPNEVAEDNYPSGMQIVQPGKHEIDFLFTPPSGNTSLEIKDADSRHIEDATGRKVFYEKVNKVATAACQPTSIALTGNRCEIAPVRAPGSGELPRETKLGKVTGQSVESHCSGSENQMVDMQNSGVSHFLRKSEDFVALSRTMSSEQGMFNVVAKEIDGKHAVGDFSRPDHLIKVEPEDVLKILDHSVAVNECSKPVNSSRSHSDNVLAENPLDGGRDSHVSNEGSSQVEGGYDSHLEDGELRESVGHCSGDDECEDRETEHVDYDSDNIEARNDSTQLSGEVLDGECEKLNTRSHNLSSADDQPNSDKTVEQNCSLGFRGCLSREDAVEKECMKGESSSVKACTMTQLKAANHLDGLETDQKGCKGLGVEADGTRKEFDNDALCNDRDASASGRGLQLSDRSVDSIRGSRSRNLDLVGGCSRNPEMKNGVAANPPLEDDGEKIFRASDDTSPRIRRPRIISTSRSGYHHISQGSTGERENDHGMGIVKTRDISPDNNARSRFHRFSNGMTRGGFRDGFSARGFRERSFSPVGDRVDHRFPRTHRKSRSRSRSISPDFRSEGRMGRTRLPYHSAGNMRGRRSPVRVFNQGQRFDSMGSPGRMRSDDCMRPMMRPVRFHNTTTSGRGHDYEENDDYRRKPFLMRNHRRSRSRSRSFSPDFRSDARMGTMRLPFQPSGDHNIRERRSPPVRVFRPGQRYDSGPSPGRFRSDDCLRPMMRPTGRGHEYNSGDEYRRKPRNIFERIHPVRNYDVDGDVRQFQYDEEDTMPTRNFRRNENYVRNGDRREERGNGRYNNSGRMFYSGPKKFGDMRDYDDDVVPRRVQP